MTQPRTDKRRRPEDPVRKPSAEKGRVDTTLDDTIESSFPASDPPSTIPNPDPPTPTERPPRRTEDG